MNKPPEKTRLQVEREIRGWSRKYVAQEIGVSDYTVGQWERGKHTPYPEHIQRLCNLFGTNAGALGLTGVTLEFKKEWEERVGATTFSPNEQQEIGSSFATAGTTSSLPHEKQRHLPSFIIGMVLALVIAVSISLYVIHSLSPARIKPGGAWISPTGSTVGDIIHFAAYAYPTHVGDPAIDHVNFTMYWQGVGPRAWIIACVVHTPIHNDIFACDVDQRHLGTPPGQIFVSFDVYDRQGNVNFSPNGKHMFTYLPSS
jgi:transcriptional regulator with XRE-family HTH domain